MPVPRKMPGLRVHAACSCCSVIVACVVMLLATAALADADEKTEALDPGALIFSQQCASCHGESGEGIDEQFTRPLVGDMSRPQLADYIEEWMPEEEPDDVVGEDAELVARYIYDAFYSPIAQARNQPAQVETSRLTASQYRNAVADLVNSFRWPPSHDDQGLNAQYYDARHPGSNRVVERVDSQVNLDFTRSDEVHEDLKPIGFAAQWSGSLLAPETGNYELIIRTDHAARLWINDGDEPLIDAWVVSEDHTEHRASIFLLGGRSYNIRLEFTSRDQGVDMEDEDEDYDPVEGFLELQWRQPHHAAEVIPPRHLSPEWSPELLVVDTPFPAEDRSVGYDRATSISRAWHSATTDAAIQTANHVTAHLDDLADIDDDDSAEQREQKLRAFAEAFAARAFRRPLADDQRERFVSRQFEQEASDLTEAVRRVVLLSLQSPRFLYLDFGGDDPDSHQIAERLSFTLWDSIPDQPLRDAADRDALTAPDKVRRHAERMVDDPRTRYKLRQFFHHWLHLEHNPEASKSADYFPDFDEHIVSDLRTSLNLFLEDIAWGDDPDFRRLMRSNDLYFNGRLAAYYGIDLPADAPFQKIPGDGPQRRGVVSHPYVMAVFAYHDATSPIHRGVILARGMLGRTLRPPPEAFTPDPPEEHPDLTTRERIAVQTEPAACMSCHSLINPLGFTLEQFDVVGRFREKDNDRPIDSSGGYERPSGETVDFDDAHDLARYLADSDEAHQAFVVQLFHHMVKQPIRGYSQDKPARMAETFAQRKEFNIRRLLAGIAATAARAGLDAETSAGEEQ